MDGVIALCSERCRLPRSSVPTQFPTQLRPQGYVSSGHGHFRRLRSDALAGSKPWDSVLVNGTGLGKDNQKMSKSLGIRSPQKPLLSKITHNALRQWAAIGGLLDLTFQITQRIESLFKIFNQALEHL